MASGRIGQVGRGATVDREPKDLALGPRLSRRAGKQPYL